MRGADKNKKGGLHDDAVLLDMIRRRGITYVLTKVALAQFVVNGTRKAKRKKGRE